MRHFLIAAAALSIGGLMATSAFAQTYVPGSGAYAASDMLFTPGGPNKLGNMCRVITDDFGNDTFGYWEPCPQQAQAQAPAPRTVRPVRR
jgi:hypothetical protein